jgi:protein-tyrosine-phosphatase
MLRQDAPARFEIFSAGTHPAGYIHPLAIAAMETLGVPMTGQHSKSWDEFAGRELDLVITLCDHAACEPSPAWEGDPVEVHWSLPDPSFRPGTEEQRLAFALKVAMCLRAKLCTLFEVVANGMRGETLRLELARRAEI